MTGVREGYTNMRKEINRLKFATNYSRMESNMIGTWKGREKIPIKGKKNMDSGETIELKEVLYVKNLSYNLISINQQK